MLCQLANSSQTVALRAITQSENNQKQETSSRTSQDDLLLVDIQVDRIDTGTSGWSREKQVSNYNDIYIHEWVSRK